MTIHRLIRSWSVSVLLLTSVSTAALAQKGEAGAGGGGSFYTKKSVTAPAGSADTGFEQGFAAGAWIGHNSSKYIGGEIRYLFEQNDLKLSSGGTKVAFAGRSHAIHYDLLIHGSPTGSKVRPYIAVGGGVKGYYGTGREQALQPLVQFAALTHTREWKGLATFGGGVKLQAGSHIVVRVDFRDYLTPFPKEVIAPARGGKISGWLHNFVPMVGISYSW